MENGTSEYCENGHLANRHTGSMTDSFIESAPFIVFDWTNFVSQQDI